MNTLFTHIPEAVLGIGFLIVAAGYLCSRVILEDERIQYAGEGK